MTDFTHHTPRLLTEADAAADLEGLPRAVSLPGVTSDEALRFATLNEQCANAWKESSEAHKFRMDTGSTIRTLVSERDALAGRVAELEAALKPNLFWNDADPEHGETSIFEVIDSEWNGGCMKHGDEMFIQQAVRLPNIRVRLIPCPTDGDDYFDYEVIDAALSTTPESKP